MMNEVEYDSYPVREGGRFAALAGPLVALGGVVVCVAAGLVAAGFVANSQAGSRATQNDVALLVERMIGSWSFLLAVAAPSMLFVALGGYLSARAAGEEGPRQALPAAVVALAVVGLLMLATPAHVPVWASLLLLAAPVPAAFVGVSLRRAAARAAQTRRHSESAPRTEPRFPRPPAHSPEDEREYAAQVASALARQSLARDPSNLTRPPVAARPDATGPAQPHSSAASHAPVPAHYEGTPGAPYAQVQAELQAQRPESLEALRAAVRAALLTHPAATEEDFERCWPAIRDEIFKQHTLRVYNTRAARDSSGNGGNGGNGSH